MRLGINLRGDLAKLDDAKIAARYEALIAEKMAWYQINRRRLGRFDPGANWRGPFHARIFYKTYMVVLNILGVFYSGLGISPKVYLRECELKDVTDEMRRRVRRGPKSAASGVTP